MKKTVKSKPTDSEIEKGTIYSYKAPNSQDYRLNISIIDGKAYASKRDLVPTVFNIDRTSAQVVMFVFSAPIAAVGFSILAPATIAGTIGIGLAGGIYVGGMLHGLNLAQGAFLVVKNKTKLALKEFFTSGRYEEATNKKLTALGLSKLDIESIKLNINRSLDGCSVEDLGSRSDFLKALVARKAEMVR